MLKERGTRMSPSELETLLAHRMDAQLEASEDSRAVSSPVSDDSCKVVHLVPSRQWDEASEGAHRL